MTMCKPTAFGCCSSRCMSMSHFHRGNTMNILELYRLGTRIQDIPFQCSNREGSLNLVLGFQHKQYLDQQPNHHLP